jgi:hypothetical protein
MVTMQLEKQIQRSKERHANPVKRAETWVRVGWVTDLTGWNKEKLRQAREQGLVEFKEDGKSYLYKLESIHPLFLKNVRPANP